MAIRRPHPTIGPNDQLACGFRLLDALLTARSPDRRSGWAVSDANTSSDLGIARGNTVRSRNAARDIFAALKNVVGGEIDEYTKLQAQAREQAISRMKDDAKSLGADGVVNVRITTSMIMQGCSEIMAYGTAVKLS